MFNKKHTQLTLIYALLSLAHGPKKRQIRVSGCQELPSGQTQEEPMPVLSLPEVPGGGHGEGG